MMKKLDPAALASVEKLDTRVTFETTNASFGELLSVVAAKAGIAITQAPELATLPVQQARFTLKADGVPAHAVLMEALMPFQLSIDPTETGVTVTKGGAHCEMIIDGAHARHEAVMETDSDGKHVVEKRRIVIKGDHAEAMKEMENQAPRDGMVERRVVIKTDGPASCKFDENGKLHRELTLNMSDNGVKSEGRLTLDISSK